MVVSFKIFLDLRRQKQDKTYTLKLRANIDGKLKEESLDISLEEKFWDKKNQKVKASHPNSQALNLRLTQCLNSYHEKVLRLQNQNKAVTADDIFKHHSSNTRFTLQEFADQEIKRLHKAGKSGNALSYQNALNKLNKYVVNRKLAFEEVDFKFIDNFATYMLENGMGVNGVAVYMREIRAIYNKALKSDIVELKYYPLAKYKIQTEKTINRPLTIPQFKSIITLSLPRETRLWHCRNYFLLSFMLIGISFVDLINLKTENTSAGRIIYRRKKTKKIYSIKLHQRTLEILNLYNEHHSTDGYLIPLLNSFSGDSSSKKNREKQILKNQNDALESLGKECGFGEKLTTYFARYTWANIAKGLGYSKDMIAEALGHEYGNKVTGIYLDEYGSDLIDEMNEKVIGITFSTKKEG